MNRFPYNSGHLLVAPVRHVGEMEEMTVEELTALSVTTKESIGWLKEVYSPHGYNLGMNLGRVAGAGLPGHIHVHIVPRWNGDANFMPIIGQTKVISEDLSSGYDRLLKVIESKLLSGKNG
jgi:ATP adenylyltransferase